MLKKNFLVWSGMSLVGIVFWLSLSSIRAQAPAAAALTGQVSSKEEGNMEGVLVSAKKAGSTIAVTVVSDQQGRYRFPANRLEPGQYSLRIRAVGYDLEGPKTVDVASQKIAAADLKLRKVSVDEMASQLTDSEWLMSAPGTEPQKDAIRGCNHCHTLERPMRTRYEADALLVTLGRMGRYAPSSFPLMVQPDPQRRTGPGTPTPESRQRQQENRRRLAEYIASINLSKAAPWEYALKTLPRPSGKSTKVIYTEYDLPARTRQPHDVIVDSQGFVWYSSFGEQILGRMNPKTGEFKEWPIPVNKPDRNKGVLDVEFDEDENVWLGNGFQNAIHMFDRKTEQFQTYPLSPEFDNEHVELLFVAPRHHKVDGKVWVMNNGEWNVFRLDLASRKWERFEALPVPRPNHYQVFSDSQNNAWFTIMGRAHIGRIDAKTGEIKLFETPTPNSGPRRGMVDSQDRVWTALNRTDQIAMFDTKTQKFQTWAVGIPEYYAYDVWADKNGEAWASTEYADRVVRINSKTGEIIPYLLPNHTNMRRAYGDNRTAPTTFWVGGTHTASIVRLEPLE